ncbi:hypothetical protein [Streptomyces sp. NBC_00239]|uniref:hypothetical protein n=1 Tax=Streptomyces sp. NBC_00239 TaxID=2903640 RepID=UPI002E2C33EF|nr:hypothetical protein [Streptomyces sp. NBC_00239]
MDSVLYYQIDKPCQGNYWLKMDTKALVDGGTSGGSSADFVGSLKQLSTLKNIRKYGEETIAGRVATRYRGSADNSLMNEKLTKMGIPVGGASGDTDVDGLDAQGMPVKMAQWLGTAHISVVFKSFGKAKKIMPPPAADVADLTEIAKARQGASSRGV